LKFVAFKFEDQRFSTTKHCVGDNDANLENVDFEFEL